MTDENKAPETSGETEKKACGCGCCCGRAEPCSFCAKIKKIWARMKLFTPWCCRTRP